jgi:hypothetical protein
VQAVGHHRHEKWRVVETFLTEHSLMPFMYGVLPHVVGTILKRDRLHDDVTLVHRSCVTFPPSDRMSEEPMHLRCLQSSNGQVPQKMRSHTCQSIYRCGADPGGALVDFWVPVAVILVVYVTRQVEMKRMRTVSTTRHLSWPWWSVTVVLWEYLKRKVLISKPRTIEELKQRI